MAGTGDCLISIIVPAYNEEKGITTTVARLKKVKFEEPSEIIVVDDGSTDDTYKEARKNRGIRIVRHAINKGKAAALDTGFSAARGDIVATTDADCTYPPEPLPGMLKTVRANKADMVLGSRFLQKKRGLCVIPGAMKKAISALAGVKDTDHTNFYGNAVFSYMISILTGRKITDGSTGLRVFRKNMLDTIKIKSKGLDWEVEMTTRALRSGFVVKEIPIEYYPRVGKTKLRPFRDGIRFFSGVVRGKFF